MNLAQLPALRAWWRRGDLKTRDVLWAAACWEAAARYSSSAARAEEYLVRADEILLKDAVALLAVSDEERRASPRPAARSGRALAGSWERMCRS